MSLTVLLPILFGFTVFVGVLIGSIGIGGVLLVPTVTYLGGIEIHTAIAVAMFSYLFTGAVGATIYARRRSIRWAMAIWLCAGAMPRSRRTGQAHRPGLAPASAPGFGPAAGRELAGGSATTGKQTRRRVSDLHWCKHGWTAAL